MFMCLVTAAMLHACCPSCSVAYFVTGTSGTDKAPAKPSAQGLGELRERLCIQNTKICCRFFWIGSCSSDRMQYCGSLLWDLGVIWLILNHKGVPYYYVMWEGRRATGFLCHCHPPCIAHELESGFLPNNAGSQISFLSSS